MVDDAVGVAESAREMSHGAGPGFVTSAGEAGLRGVLRSLAN